MDQSLVPLHAACWLKCPERIPSQVLAGERGAKVLFLWLLDISQWVFGREVQLVSDLSALLLAAVDLLAVPSRSSARNLCESVKMRHERAWTKFGLVLAI